MNKNLRIMMNILGSLKKIYKVGFGQPRQSSIDKIEEVVYQGEARRQHTSAP